LIFDPCQRASALCNLLKRQKVRFLMMALAGAGWAMAPRERLTSDAAVSKTKVERESPGVTLVSSPHKRAAFPKPVPD